MDTARWPDYLQLAALGCLGFMAVGRGVMLAARGVGVIAIDRQRTAAEVFLDVLSLACLGFGAYEVVAWAAPVRLPLPAGLRNGWPGSIVVGSEAAKVAGAVMAAGGLVVYALALRALGASWRLGVDREGPGPLVTTGVYGWSRNPVYVGLTIFAFGIALLQGRLVSFVLAAATVAIVHYHVLREERFLLGRFGEAYRGYAERVGRYVSWGRPPGRGRPGGAKGR